MNARKFTRRRGPWTLTVVQNGAAECDVLLDFERAPGQWEQRAVDRFAPAAQSERARFLAVAVDDAARPAVDVLLQEVAALSAQHVPFGTGGEPRESAADARPPFLDDEAVELLPPPEFVVDDFAVRNGLSVLYGPPGCGKSFLALALACSVGTGRGVFGRAVRRGGVVYVAAEGSAGLGVRLRAWKQHYGFTGRAGVHFRMEPVQLLDTANVGHFIADMATLPEPPALIILDTFHRCLVGGDENSAQDVGNAIAAADRMRRDTGAAVLILHHTRKDGESERGSTALRGAADTMVSMRPAAAVVRVDCEKQKDGPAFAPFDLRLQVIGESCVLVTPKIAWEREARELTRQHRQLLDSLSRDFLDDGAPAGQWQKASKVPEASFYRARTDLVAWGYVVTDKPEARARGARYTLTPDGQDVVTPHSQITLNSLSESEPNSLPPAAPFLERADGESEGELPSVDLFAGGAP